MSKILVVVSGGNVQGVNSDDPNIDIEVFDEDNLRDTMTGDEIDKLFKEKIKNYPNIIW